MTRVLRTAILAVLASCTAVELANAHAQLKAAGPAPGSTVNASPKAIRIEFNEPVEVKFSGIELTNEGGQKQTTGTASIMPNDKKQMIVPVNGELAPGKYTVVWHAVGDDTHRVEGRFNFEIKR